MTPENELLRAFLKRTLKCLEDEHQAGREVQPTSRSVRLDAIDTMRLLDKLKVPPVCPTYQESDLIVRALDAQQDGHDYIEWQREDGLIIRVEGKLEKYHSDPAKRLPPRGYCWMKPGEPQAIVGERVGTSYCPHCGAACAQYRGDLLQPGLGTYPDGSFGVLACGCCGKPLNEIPSWRFNRGLK